MALSRSSKTRSVPALERALSIIEVLASSRGGLALSDLSRRQRLPKSSMYSLLLTLERHGYILRSVKTKRYLFGAKLLGLASSAPCDLELRNVAHPLLRELMQATSLTVHMAILGRDEAVIIDKVDPPGMQRLATWVGKRMDLHSTAVGKALLAYLPADDLLRMTHEHSFPRSNENTITSARRLEKEREQIRRLGYAVEQEESELGYCCIGAPIFDQFGRTAASISVAGTVEQITPGNLSSLGAEVKRTTARISAVFVGLASEWANPPALEVAN